MSILIKGMEMPKNCSECKLGAIIPIGDYDTYSICPPLHRHIDKYTDTRRTDCPLIEINIPIVIEKPKNDGQYERRMERAKRCGKGVKFEHQWIFADLDTIIDCYSESPKEET